MGILRRPAAARLRHMEIGDLLTYRGRPCILRGLEPMSVPDRRVEVEDDL